MRAKLIGVALAMLLAPLAMMVSWAGELPTKGKIAAPVATAAADDAPRWSGVSIYGAAGYGLTRTEYDAIAAGGSIDSQNFLATAGLGYDMQMSGLVLGIMADVTGADLANEARWQWFVGARAGVLITPRTLVYALAGYTEDLDGKLTFSASETTNIRDLAGLTVGGGLEHAFGQGWAGRAEYRYVSFGSKDAPDGVADGLVDGSSIDTGEHQVRLGLVKRF